MTKYPHAVWMPLSRNEAHQAPLTQHDIVCLHTMAGSLGSTDALFKGGGYVGTESHFGVGPDGTIHQYTSLDRRADANLDSNYRVISIETADKGPPFPSWTGSNVPAWTEEQIESISQITAWCCEKYDIPPRMIPDTLPSRRGIGYHRQGIEGNWSDGSGYKRGEKWSSSSGKACPGDRRIDQLKSRVVPRVHEILTGDEMQQADFERIGKMLDHKLAPLERAVAAFRESERARDASVREQIVAFREGERTRDAAVRERLKQLLDTVRAAGSGASADEIQKIVQHGVEEVLAATAPTTATAPPPSA